MVLRRFREDKSGRHIFPNWNLRLSGWLNSLPLRLIFKGTREITGIHTSGQAARRLAGDVWESCTNTAICRECERHFASVSYLSDFVQGRYIEFLRHTRWTRTDFELGKIKHR
jgi:hypothetical protein